jgi:rhamnosyltransferase subunit B
VAPLHAILVTTGTDGDVYPYVGLGAALRAHGHRVTLVTNEHFRSTAEDHGFAFQTLVSRAELDELYSNPDFWHPIKTAPLMARWGARFLDRQYELLAGLAGDPDTVLVLNPGVLAGRLVQEMLGRPAASIVLQPWFIPSAEAPPVMPGGVALPRWAPRPVARLYFRLIDAVVGLLIGRPLNRLRSRLGLRPVRRVYPWWLSPELALGLFPDWYGPPQADWPPQVRLTGFPLYDGRPGAGLPADVLAFCRSGAPPVAFTFGTGMMHAAGLFRAAVDACGRLGARGLLLTKYGHQLPDPLPPTVRHCAFAPFRQLFPHCAAVVHHGGVGTVSQALAAGTPQLVLPIAFDQLDNATRVRRLGAGDWLKPNRRGGAALADALARLMTPAVRERCRAVAARFAGDDSLAVAARCIEELANRATDARRKPAARPHKSTDVIGARN